MFSLTRSVAAVAAVLVGAGAASAQTAGTYTVSGVTSFQQTAGNFGASNLQRVRGLRVVVGANRAVSVTFPDTWYGTLSGRLTPVPGRANLYQFSASRTLSTGVGVNVVAVQVVIQVNGSGVPVALAVASRAGNSVAAVVNGTGFGSGVSSAYTAAVTLRRR